MPLKIGRNPNRKGKRLPTIHFQGRFAVSFREGKGRFPQRADMHLRLLVACCFRPSGVGRKFGRKTSRARGSGNKKWVSSALQIRFCCLIGCVLNTADCVKKSWKTSNTSFCHEHIITSILFHDKKPAVPTKKGWWRWHESKDVCGKKRGRPSLFPQGFFQAPVHQFMGTQGDPGPSGFRKTQQEIAGWSGTMITIGSLKAG